MLFGPVRLQLAISRAHECWDGQKICVFFPKMYELLDRQPFCGSNCLPILLECQSHGWFLQGLLLSTSLLV